MSYEFISSTLIIYYVDYCSNDVSISNIFTYWFTRKHIISYVYVYNVYIYTPNHTCIMYAKGVRPRYCYSLTLLLHVTYLQSQLECSPRSSKITARKSWFWKHTAWRCTSITPPKVTFTKCHRDGLCSEPKCSSQAIFDTNNKHLDVPGS